MNKEKQKHQISNTTAFFMVVVAIIYDLLSIIPLVNDFTVIFAGMHFGMWFVMKGVSLIRPARLLTFMGSGIIEAIPAASILPMITVSVVVSIVTSRIEDRMGIKMPLSKIGGGTLKQVVAK